MSSTYGDCAVEAQAIEGAGAIGAGATIDEDKTAAIIILYHPQTEALRRLVASLHGQVGQVFAVDNTPGCCSEQSPFADSAERWLTYIPLGDNYGIAAAQNIGIAQAAHFSHVLLLDQDSALSFGMVEKLLAAERALLLSGSQVGAVGPLFTEASSGRTSRAIQYRRLRVKRRQVDPLSAMAVESDYVIASGSLIRTSVLAEIGTMQADLFIDWVDVEWGLRARKLGYKSYIVPQAVMSHCLGDSTARAMRKYVPLHSDVRNYYIVRNATYLLRTNVMNVSWRLITAAKVPFFIAFYSWHSRAPGKSLALLTRALSHGLRGRLGRMS